MDSIKKKMQSLSTETANAQVDNCYCSLLLLSLMFLKDKRTRFEQTHCVLCENGCYKLDDKTNKEDDNQTADQARCERWEKEAVVVVVVVFLVVVVAFVVVVDDDVFLMLLLSLLIAVITIPNVRLVARDGRRRLPPRTPQPIISKTRS